MGVLYGLGRFMRSENNKSSGFWGTVTIAALMTWGFQTGIDDTWDAGSENEVTEAQEITQNISDISQLAADHKAEMTVLDEGYKQELVPIDKKQEEIDLLKALDENRNGAWLEKSDQTKEYMWNSHVFETDRSEIKDRFDTKSDILKNSFSKADENLRDEVYIDLLTNQDISEQKYLELRDAYAAVVYNTNLEEYGEGLRECQLRVPIKSGQPELARAAEINDCMDWRDDRDALDWAAIIPFLLFGLMTAGPLGNRLYKADEYLKKRKAEPKKAATKPN